ncbi:MAG: HU family DNA-binding protein [Marinifilaceae bacterium]
MPEYKIISKKNPSNPEAEPKYYANVVNGKEADLDYLCQRIAASSTVSRTDAYAVIMGLMETISFELKEGRIVRLGELGSLYVTINCEGTDTEEEFNETHIKQANIRFRPGKELKELTKTMKFRKVNKVPVAAD